MTDFDAHTHVLFNLNKIWVYPSTQSYYFYNDGQLCLITRKGIRGKVFTLRIDAHTHVCPFQFE